MIEINDTKIGSDEPLQSYGFSAFFKMASGSSAEE